MAGKLPKMIATLGVASVSALFLFFAAARFRAYSRSASGGERATARLAATVCVLVGAPAAAVAAYLAACLVAPPADPVKRALGPGVDYERRFLEAPRRAAAHLVRIDPAARTRFAVTSPEPTPHGLRTRAATSREALERLDADLVVNASFFRPFRDEWLLDYWPKRGSFTEPIGTTISDGIRYGLERPTWPTLGVDGDGRVRLGVATHETVHAVSGRVWLVRGGVAERLDEPAVYPRTALGLDGGGYLWIVVIDGKQPRYSAGLRLDELAAFLVTLGIEEAIELDGGGSAALAIRTPSGRHEILNRPIHTHFPGRERPVANHLGISFGRE